MPIPPASALLTNPFQPLFLSCTCILFELAPGKQGADSDRGKSTGKNLLLSFPLHNPREVQVVCFPTQENVFSIIRSVHLQTDTGAFSGCTHPVAPGCHCNGVAGAEVVTTPNPPRCDALPLRCVQFTELQLEQEWGGSDQARSLQLSKAGNTTPYEPFLPLRAALE